MTHLNGKMNNGITEYYIPTELINFQIVHVDIMGN